jgi:hypothetical protein
MALQCSQCNPIAGRDRTRGIASDKVTIDFKVAWMRASKARARHRYVVPYYRSPRCTLVLYNFLWLLQRRATGGQGPVLAPPPDRALCA